MSGSGSDSSSRATGSWAYRRAIPVAVPGLRRRRRLPVDLQEPLLEVEDPVVGNPGPRVEAGLLAPSEIQARIGDLDDENGMRRVCISVVTSAAGHDGDVGLWLGVVVERDGPLRANGPVRPEDLSQHVLDEPDGREVRAALWLTDEEGCADQLQALAGPEGAQVDESLVLDAGPALGTDGRGQRHTHQASPDGPTPSTSRCRYTQQVHGFPLPLRAHVRVSPSSPATRGRDPAELEAGIKKMKLLAEHGQKSPGRSRAGPVDLSAP